MRELQDRGANSPQGRVRLELVTDRAGFDALERPWNALFARAGRPQHVFQQFNWLWHWANHYLDARASLCVVTAWRGERLVMVWPLVCVGRAPLRRLAFMGEPVSQYGDALVEDGPDAAALMRAGWDMARACGADVAHLRKARADSNVARLLGAGGALVSMRDAAPCLDLASAPDFETYVKRHPGKARSSRRRYLRRLQGFGEVTFEEHDPGLMARELAAVAMRHKKAWVARHGVIAPALADPRFEKFFADVAAGHSHPAPLRIVVVRCAGQPVGVEISLICGSHLFGHVIACDPEFEKKGAGSVLAEYAVAAAHRRGFAVYDLLAPADAYKSEWADASAPVCDYAAPLSLFGALYARPWLCGLRPFLKETLDNAPPWLGRRLTRAFGRGAPPRERAYEKPRRPASQLG